MESVQLARQYRLTTTASVQGGTVKAFELKEPPYALNALEPHMSEVRSHSSAVRPMLQLAAAACLPARCRTFRSGRSDPRSPRHH